MRACTAPSEGGCVAQVAKKTVKVVVVGNPCNTNALICSKNAPSIPPENFHALTRLDENRAKFQLAQKAGVFFTSVDRVVVWGNHSTTQVRSALASPVHALSAVLPQAHRPRRPQCWAPSVLRQR